MKLKNLPVYPFTLGLIIYPGLFATHPEPRATEGRSLEGSGGPLGALTQKKAGDFLKGKAEALIRKPRFCCTPVSRPFRTRATAVETQPSVPRRGASCSLCCYEVTIQNCQSETETNKTSICGDAQGQLPLQEEAP